MKSVMFLSLILILSMGILMAGGIVTNTNQSAAYMRTLNRNASVNLDAVYYNPAGLASLNDGLHLSLNNQSIWQTKTVTNTYLYLKGEGEFVGKVSAPVFPNIYAAFKTGKLAVSAGFEPIGGGGSANFEKGLPSFEMPISDLVPGLASQGASAYDLDVAFEGSSIYYGFQGNVSYKVSDLLSVGVGGRYVMASNKYIGHLKSIGVVFPDALAANFGGNPVPAPMFFTYAAGQYTAGATSASNAASGLQPLIDGGGGTLTLDQAQAAGFLDATQVAQLQGGLTAAGLNPADYPTIAATQAAYNGVAASATASAAGMTAKATLLSDQEVDVTQKASGFAPIISILISPMKGLDVALRYEGLTKLELENEADADKQALVGFDANGNPVYQFPDGAKSRADMPAMLGLGVSYKIGNALRTEFGLNYYMNSGVDWNGREANVDNGYEVGLAVEYCLSEKLKASLGFLNSNSGAKPEYQTDLSYSLKSNAIGLGIAYAISPNLLVNIGGINTFYIEDSRDDQHNLGGSGTIVPFTEKYLTKTFGFAVGIDYSF